MVLPHKKLTLSYYDDKTVRLCDWIISTIYFNNKFENSSVDNIIKICNKYIDWFIKIKYIGKKLYI